MSGRSRCQCCGGGIPKGSLRFAEAFTSQYSPDVQARFHHLECAADSFPLRLRPALADLSSRDAVFDEVSKLRSLLHGRIEQALSHATLGGAPEEATRAQHERFIELIEAAPADEPGPVMVLADWLQSIGHPRGALIALSLAKETATGERWTELHEAARAHLERHKKELVPELGGRLLWRRGFIHRVELDEESVVLAWLEQHLQHPSFRLLRELAVTHTIAAELRALAPTLRKLEIRGHVGVGPGSLRALLATAPRLRSLTLHGLPADKTLEHAALAELSITSTGEPPFGEDDASRRPLSTWLRRLNRNLLPELAHLAVHVRPEHGDLGGLDAACEALAKANVTGALTHLHLSGPALSDEGAHALATARRRSQPLEALQVHVTTSPRLPREVRTILRPLATELIEGTIATKHHSIHPQKAPGAAAPSSDEWLVRNPHKPEWGIGRVIDERDDSLVVLFEHAGRRLVRSPELLEDA